MTLTHSTPISLHCTSWRQSLAYPRQRVGTFYPDVHRRSGSSGVLVLTVSHGSGSGAALTVRYRDCLYVHGGVKRLRLIDRAHRCVVRYGRVQRLLLPAQDRHAVLRHQRPMRCTRIVSAFPEVVQREA